MRYTQRWGWVDDGTSEPPPTNAERKKEQHDKAVARVKANTKAADGSGRHSANED